MLGFIGLGTIGSAMARRLLSTGEDVVVWNRSPGPTELLAEMGAKVASNPAQINAQADLIGLCLTSHQAVEDVGWGANSLFSQPLDGSRTIVDFSTGSPEAAKSFAERARAAGAGWVDAPFTGGVAAAEQGKLVFFAGGEAEDLASLDPLLSLLAARVTHMGSSGMGQVTKLCNNALAACNLMMMAEMIAMARKAGIDPSRLPEAFRGGAADSPHFQIIGQRMADRQFEPRLGAIALIEKDIRLIEEMAQRIGAHIPLMFATRDLYKEARASPNISMQQDVSCLINLFE